MIFAFRPQARIVAVCMTALLLLPDAALAKDAGKTLYERMRSVTQREKLLAPDDNLITDAPLKKFAVGTGLPQDTGEITTEDIDPLLRGSDAPCTKNPALCPQTRESASSLILREQWLRSLGNDLQIIASSYESPLLGDTAIPITARMQAIGQMWKADVETDETPPGANVQFRMAEEGTVSGGFAALGDDLRKLVGDNGDGFDDDTLLTAAVWRYRFGGERWVNEIEQQGGADEQPEQALLHEHFPDIENDLRSIRDALVSSLGTADLPTKGQSVSFTFPSSLNDSLPENVRVWAFVERTKEEQIISDAGLQFVNATEPVQPLLCKRPEGAEGQPDAKDCTIVPGGRYPPARPKDAPHPLCNNPLMAGGYLCNPIKKEKSQDCANDVSGNGFTLTRCESGEKPKETPAGGDVCEDPSWQRGSAFDPRTNCKIKLSCENGDPKNFRVSVNPKTADGVIEVTLTNDPLIAVEPFMLAGLAGAQTTCNLPPGTEIFPPDSTPEQKCTRYMDFMRVTCNAFAEDGIFDYIRDQGESFPFNIETCAALMTDSFMRKENGLSCPGLMTEHLDDETVNQLSGRMTELSREWSIERNNQAARDGTPEKRRAITCDEMVNVPKGQVRDPRVDAAIRAVERSGRDPCEPGKETSYRNSIGNNICYINQCLDTQHRLTPGRTPFNEGDLAYPYDLCIPSTQPLLPVIPTISAETDWTPPAYRPYPLLQYIREQLCPGMGAGTPLCTSNPFRRINLQPKDLLELGNDAERQEQDFQEPGEMFRQMGEAVGSRIGNRLYGEYLKKRAQTLTDFVQTAATLLLQFPKTTFPTAACPTDSRDIIQMCQQNWQEKTPAQQ